MLRILSSLAIRATYPIAARRPLASYLTSLLALGACLAAACLTTTASAQPYRVADLRSQSSVYVSPGSYILGTTGSHIYFYGTDVDHGESIWRSDGTLEGTELAGEFWPGDLRIYLGLTRGGAVFGDKVFFGARDSVTGQEMWQSDGTPQGTFLVSDSLPGTTTPYLDHAVPVMDTAGGLVYWAEDARGLELWVTDKTPGGGQFLADVVPGVNRSDHKNAVTLDGVGILHIDSGVEERILASDGTPSGTFYLTADIDLSSYLGDPAERIVIMGDNAYFWGRDPAAGVEIWKTDGTVAGTSVALDIAPGAASSNPLYLTSDGSTLYFRALGEPWLSDGTLVGTRQIADLNGGNPSDPRHFTPVSNGKVFFLATTDADDEQLWVTDGTAAGTLQLLTVPIGSGRGYEQLTAVGDQLFFLVEDLNDGFRKLWVSDGTPSGTFRLDPTVAGGPELVWAEGMKDIGGTAIFNGAVDRDTYYLWTSDGTNAGTQILSEDLWHDHGSNPDQLIALDDALVFRATDDSTNLGLWATRGAGASLLAGGQGQQADVRQPRHLVRGDDRVFFSATTTSGDGDEVFFVDGGFGSAQPFTDLPLSGGITALGYANGLAFFTYFGSDGREPWVSDGTPAGTFQLADLRAGSNSDPSEFTQVGSTSRVVFAARSGTQGRELFVSDGTTAGTQLIADLRAGAGSSEPEFFTRALGKVFFIATPGSSRALFSTDGTASGTNVVASLGSSIGPSYPAQVTEALGRVFFTVENSVAGEEVWSSDGTFGGSQMVFDANPGAEGSSPTILGEYAGRLWFVAFDGTTAQLYSTTGSAPGTVAVKALERLSHDGVTGPGRVFEDRLYFSCWNLDGGVELWSTDGTDAGTGPAADLHAGHLASNPKDLTLLEDSLGFSASDGSNREIWMLPSEHWIFGDGLETLDTSAWDAELEFGADVLVNAEAAHLGEGGLEVVVDADDDRGSVADLTPDDERVYRVSFFFDPNDMVFPENKRLKILSTRMADNKRHIEAALRWRAATGYQLRVKTHHENLSDWFGTFWHDVDPDGSQITIEWQQASAPGVADGVLKLRIDGVLVETVNGIINGDLPGTDWVQLGVVGGVTPGISGSHLFDDFRSWSSLLP